MMTKPRGIESKHVTVRNSVGYLREPYTFVDRPLAWQAAGLSQTRSGYGRKLASTRCVVTSDGLTRRVYVTQYSNAGTAWIEIDGQTFVVVLDQ